MTNQIPTYDERGYYVPAVRPTHEYRSDARRVIHVDFEQDRVL